MFFNKEYDRIKIVAPSSKPRGGQTILNDAMTLLNKRGYNASYEEGIFSDDAFLDISASLEVRVSHIKNALKDKQVKIIWAIRGGYGATELINALTTEDLEINGEKVLIGFSDITALHFLMQQYNINTIHAPVLSSLFGLQSDMQDIMFRFLEGEKQKYPLNNISQTNNDAAICGEIIGGNLEIITNLIGTKLALDFANKILILEDVNEEAYAVYRSLVHLNNAGLLAGLKAIIFGDFNFTDEIDQVKSKQIDQAIFKFSQQYIPEIPRFRMKGFGHDIVNYPICLGSEVKIIDNHLITCSPFSSVSNDNLSESSL